MAYRLKPSRDPLYIANQPFGPSDGSRWKDYVAWSGLTQLTELVSVDPMLCPLLLDKTLDHYWPHIVNADFMTDFFVDFEFLRQETKAFARKNILCVYINPLMQPASPGVPAGFQFLGYDLSDVTWSVSALSNCGGFPKAFDNGELSQHGLLSSLERANEVREKLKQHYPDEHHANCDVWALFRLEDAPATEA